MLHLTNGDSAADAIRATGVPGDIVAWRDVLHEGPVPGDAAPDELRAIRARFIAERGWADEADVLADFARRDAALAAAATGDEIVLWFEHDLYDQLQLGQALDGLAGLEEASARLTLVAPADYLGPMSPDTLRALFDDREPVTPEQLDLARRAWAAFGGPEPTAVHALLGERTDALPFLAPALRRLLEELPWTTDGLSRCERQALEAVAAGRRRLKDVFVASHHEREDPVFLGDATFGWHLERLSAVPESLVVLDDGSPVRAPRTDAERRTFWTREARLTPAGRRVLDGEDDSVALNGIDRWIGGTHLVGGAYPGGASPGAARRRAVHPGDADRNAGQTGTAHADEDAAVWRWDPAASAPRRAPL